MLECVSVPVRVIQPTMLEINEYMLHMQNEMSVANE